MPATTTTRVAVFAVHRLEAEGLASLLARSEDLEVVCVAADVHTLAAVAGSDRPDVVLLDAPVEEAIAIAASVRATARRVPVVVIAEPADAELTTQAALAGIEAVVAKDSPASAMVMAVHQVAAGSTVYPAMRSIVSTRLRSIAGLRSLSRRQREVLRLVAAGHSNTEIAETLFISVNTVKFHLRCIFRELGLHNRVQAAQRYAELAGSADG